MRRPLAIILLALESGVTFVHIAGLVYTIAAYEPLAIGVLIARALAGAGLATAAWLLAQDAAPANAIARGAVVASAAVYLLDAGLALAPSIAPAFWRWPFVGGYWLYAIVLVAALRPARADSDASGPGRQ